MQVPDQVHLLCKALSRFLKILVTALLSQAANAETALRQKVLQVLFHSKLLLGVKLKLL